MRQVSIEPCWMPGRDSIGFAATIIEDDAIYEAVWSTALPKKPRTKAAQVAATWEWLVTIASCMVARIRDGTPEGEQRLEACFPVLDEAIQRILDGKI
jgi:hypothetical protein